MKRNGKIDRRIDFVSQYNRNALQLLAQLLSQTLPIT